VGLSYSLPRTQVNEAYESYRFLRYAWARSTRARRARPHFDASVMIPVADFNQAELWTIETTLRERYGTPIEIQLADSEVRLRSTDRELTTCPVVFWQHGECNFVIIKTGDKLYRAQFYYRLHEQYGTGVAEYDDLAECTVSLLQAQADHDRERQQENSR
jgi:hypothetical protein